MGFFRLYLSLCVVDAHLALGQISGQHYYAIFGFYAVSGFLISRVLVQHYGFSISGSLRFWANRALRIYPAYFCVALGTFLTITFYPQELASFHPAFAIKTRPIDYLGNVSIVAFAFYDRSFRLVPPAWSLAVEIICYFLIWLCMARRISGALLGIAIASAWVIYAYMQHWPFGERYTPVIAGLLPFSFGALAFHLSSKPAISRFLGENPGSRLILVAFILNGFATMLWPHLRFDSLYYLNVLLSAALTAWLAQIKFRSKLVAWVDTWCGKLSYPVFLMHWLIGFFVLRAFPTLQGNGKTWALVALPFIVVASILLVLLIEQPIERARTKIRGEKVYK